MKRVILYFIIALLFIVDSIFVTWYTTIQAPGKLSFSYPSRLPSVVALGHGTTIDFIFRSVESGLRAKAPLTFTLLDVPYSQRNIENAVETMRSMRVDLILTGQNELPIVQKSFPSTPIVVVQSSDVVRSGLADSELGSGFNAAFVDGGYASTMGERLRFFHMLHPKAKTVLLLRNSALVPGLPTFGVDILREKARELDIAIIDRSFSTRKELNDFLLTFDFSTVDAIYQYPGAFMSTNDDLLYALEPKFKKPILGVSPKELDKGAILIYSPNVDEMAALALELSTKIFYEHVNPAFLPIQHVEHYVVRVNEKKANEYGLTISPQLRTLLTP